MSYVLTQFANQPLTTVTTGGTGAPATGSSEQWTVASSSAFPTASVSATPSTGFNVADTANTSEIIAVTAITGAVWGVIRGAENTTPVAHSAGFGITQVVSANDYAGFGQLTETGSTVASTIAASTALGTIGTWTPPAISAPAPGVVYDFHAYGAIWNTTVGFTIAVTWNGTTVAALSSLNSGSVPTAGLATSPFWLEGRVGCWTTTTMTAGLNFQSFQTAGTHSVATMVAASTAGVSVTGTGPLSLVAVTGAGGSVHTTGWYIHRIS